ncbi:hypothetical protein ABZ807_21140 [Micromonospora sp. NPDC047548]|uniref:hypothetical protein n=1 Tax=Micromonospora sp. NPDC047548 TaxID=3155624 RepID=UPI0033C91301
MTSTATIEDALASILGLVLGGGESGDKSSINDSFRPQTIKGPGFWLITQKSTLKHTGGWAPEYNKDAVTFYRWTQDGSTKDITRLTVWVGVTNKDNQQGQERNTTDPTKTINGESNPVVSLGAAWERIRDDIPKVAGVGTSFDPNSIAAVREILGNLTSHAMKISGELTDEMKSVNVKNPEFKGSAESAWYHRVQSANRYLSDILPQFTRWNTALSQAETAMKDFVKALLDAIDKWSQITPAGTWQHPYRVIAAMFNQSTLAYADLHNGQSNAWDLGTQYANTGDEEAQERRDGTTVGGKDVGTVLWTPPSWLNYHSFDAFNIGEWNKLDHHLRQLWADNVINTFAPALIAAKNLVTVFADARNPMHITDPDPVPPLPMPNNLGMPNWDNAFPNWDNAFPNWDNAFPNWDNAFPNWDNAFPNWDNAFPDWGNAFPNWDSAFPNWGSAFPNWGSAFPNGGAMFASGGVGDPFPNGVDNPFANGGVDTLFAGGGMDTPFTNGQDSLIPTSSFSKLDNPFANGAMDSSFAGGGMDTPLADGQDNGSMFSKSVNPFADSGFPVSSSQLFNKLAEPQTLGDLTPAQLRQLDSAGLLDDVPLSAEQAAYLRENGLAVPNGTTTLGQLTPNQLAALQKGGLLDQTPLTDAQRANLGLTDPQTLGDLTPAQLRQLDSAGLLDDVPLSAEQAAYLRESGLAVPNGTTALGQLTPDQLVALQKGGLLDQIPLTPAERANLGLTTPSGQSGGAVSVPGLDLSKLPWHDIGPTSPVDRNPFPTTVDGKEVSFKPDISGIVTPPPLGDVTKPGAAVFPAIPGVQVGTGGLSSVPGVSGSAGALSQDGFGRPVGGPGGAGSGAGVTTGAGTGAGITQTSPGGMPFGGMPYMPGMPGMFGGTGQPNRDRDRQRSTWLKEDEKVWGTDPDCAPAVIGRRGRNRRVEDDEYDTPADERPGSQDERRPYRGR